MKSFEVIIVGKAIVWTEKTLLNIFSTSAFQKLVIYYVVHIFRLYIWFL